MTHLFVGWDVGAWHCDDGDSRDALCVLTATPSGSTPRLADLDSLTLAAPPVRTNLRQTVNSRDPLAAMLQAANVEHVSGVTNVCVAIDTPLGWPAAFRRVLDGSGILPLPGEVISDNEYLFRATERMLLRSQVRGRTTTFSPLSAVRDMIGAQSTKGLHFLRRAGLALLAPGIWSRNIETQTWVTLETYPTPARESSLLGRWWAGLERHDAFYRGVQTTWVNHRSDIKDALWCALVAAVFVAARDELVAPPPALDETTASEGWIWLPRDAFASTDPTETIR
jgi:hypothetical protein